MSKYFNPKFFWLFLTQTNLTQEVFKYSCHRFRLGFVAGIYNIERYSCVAVKDDLSFSYRDSGNIPRFVKHVVNELGGETSRNPKNIPSRIFKNEEFRLLALYLVKCPSSFIRNGFLGMLGVGLCNPTAVTIHPLSLFMIGGALHKSCSVAAPVWS